MMSAAHSGSSTKRRRGFVLQRAAGRDLRSTQISRQKQMTSSHGQICPHGCLGLREGSSPSGRDSGSFHVRLFAIVLRQFRFFLTPFQRLLDPPILLRDLFNTPARQPAPTSPTQAAWAGPEQLAPLRPALGLSVERHQKCRFLTEGTAKLKKTVRRRVAKDSTASLNESGTAGPRQSRTLDAGAELLRSAPAAPSQPPHAEVKVADAASDLVPHNAVMSTARISAQAYRLHAQPSRC